MNRPQRFTGARLRAPIPSPAFTRAHHYLTDCYLPMIHKLVALRREQGSGIVIAFTSISRGEGVSYVVDSLAWHLAQHTGDSILLTNFGGLASAGTAEFWEPQSIQRLTQHHPRSQRAQQPSWETVQDLRSRFGFVLVDCPALRESAGVLSLPQVCDGVVLVVAAGEAKPEEIGFAQKTLEAASSNLLGLVLNKRTNPIPRLFSKFV
jgi:Mrp family chromosome partitioning ATPase